MLKTLEELIELIRERKKSSDESSYTKKLLHDKNLSLEKVKEEVGELIEAVDKNTNTQVSPYKILSNSLANGSGLLLDTVGQSVELLWTTKNKWFVIGGTGCSLLPPN